MNSDGPPRTEVNCNQNCNQHVCRWLSGERLPSESGSDREVFPDEAAHGVHRTSEGTAGFMSAQADRRMARAIPCGGVSRGYPVSMSTALPAAILTQYQARPGR